MELATELWSLLSGSLHLIMFAHMLIECIFVVYHISHVNDYNKLVRSSSTSYIIASADSTSWIISCTSKEERAQVLYPYLIPHKWDFFVNGGYLDIFTLFSGSLKLNRVFWGIVSHFRLFRQQLPSGEYSFLQYRTLRNHAHMRDMMYSDTFCRMLWDLTDWKFRVI